MKLLIITQKVDINDDVLGFFHRWIEEFAKYCEKVTVVCLQKGEYSLPENVKVLSLGKEIKASKLKYIFNFYKYIWQERKNYDAVFVHMNSEYIILGGIFWRLLNKKIGLWYVHRKVNLKLKIAEKFTDEIFTVAKESFQLQSKKLNIVGHGIDIGSFACEKLKNKSDIINILHVGRITKIKNVDILIKAAAILCKKINTRISFIFIGAPITEEDKRYFVYIKDLIDNLQIQDRITFLGSIPNKEIKSYYCQANIVVNMAPTGGVDKVILEAMASKTPVLTSNKAFLNYFEGYSDLLMFQENDPNDMAFKIENILKFEKEYNMRSFLYDKVLEVADIRNLIKNIILKLKNV